MLKRRTFLNAGAMAGLAALTPQRLLAAEDALVEAARAEGRVVWYSSMIENAAVRPMAAAFEARYPGIRVETVTGKSGDLLIRIRDEIAVGRLHADVFNGATTLQTLQAAGEVAGGLAHPAGYPADLVDEDGQWVAQVVNFQGPACNTTMVAEDEMPRTYADLLHPRWKGQIAWSNALQQGGPPGFIGTVLHVMGEAAGMDYLGRLSEQRIVNVPAAQIAVLDKVVVGEFPLALCIYWHHVEIAAAKGAPVRWLQLDPMNSGTIDPAFTLAKAAHPNAARLLIDFIASDEGQAVLRGGGYTPASPAMRNPGQSPVAFTIKPRHLAENIERWITIYDQLFK